VALRTVARTAVLRSPREFGVVGRPIGVPGPHEVRVRIAATALCHTDLSIYTGQHPGVRYPVVLGHECTGIIDALGDAVVGLRCGQAVIINPIVSCGRCDSCRRGAENLCREAGLFGREVDGSLSDCVTIDARSVSPLPERMPLDQATIIETLATVRHAQQRLGIAPGESVVVLGEGTSGLLHTRLAVLRGAHPVIAVSRSRWKLDLATGMGAHHAVRASTESAASEVSRLTDRLGADVVIDTTGSTTAMSAAIDMLRPGGRFLPYAVSHECCAGFTTFPVYYKEITIIGSRALNREDMAPAIALVTSGDIDVSGFISATYALEHVHAAFREYERSPGGVLRIVIAH